MSNAWLFVAVIIYTIVSMYDIVCIGSALVDTFITSRNFQLQPVQEGVLLCQRYGDKIDVDDFSVTTGGGGSNTAVGFARMGFSVALVAETGSDVLSKVVLDDLHHEKVSTTWMIAEKKEKTGGSVILIGEDGGRSVLVHRGAASQLDAQDIPAKVLTTSTWVHLSSISGRVPALRAIFSAVASSQTGCSWNPGKGELELLNSGELPLSDVVCDVLILNKQEWELVARRHQEILAQVPIVVITDGRNGGSVTVSGNQTQQYTSRAVSVVDETGAGDSFCVGFVSALLRGTTIEQACNWAVISATSVVEHVGAKPGLLTQEQLSDRLSAAQL